MEALLMKSPSSCPSSANNTSTETRIRFISNWFFNKMQNMRDDQIFILSNTVGIFLEFSAVLASIQSWGSHIATETQGVRWVSFTLTPDGLKSSGNFSCAFYFKNIIL